MRPRSRKRRYTSGARPGRKCSMTMNSIALSLARKDRNDSAENPAGPTTRDEPLPQIAAAVGSAASSIFASRRRTRQLRHRRRRIRFDPYWCAMRTPLDALTRRELIRLLSAGVAAGLASATATARSGWPGPLAQPSGPERGAIVRTLLADLAPDELGAGPVLFHEHLSNIWPIGSPSSFTDDVDLMIAETRSAGHDGVR